jgi:hypothetical protein
VTVWLTPVLLPRPPAAGAGTRSRRHPLR